LGNKPFTLTIDSYATDQDILGFAKVLQESGNSGLREVLWRKHAGTLSVAGGLGYEVSFAVVRDSAEGRIVRVFVNRPLSEPSVAYNTRASHYPFSIVELYLDGNGQGDGSFIDAGRLSYTERGLVIKTLAAQATLMMGVRSS
jgi:hypothetical protein